MKTFLVFFVILCSTAVDINCKDIEAEMDKALELCLEEYGITEIDVESFEIGCFETCIALKAEIIKDKKFDLKKYADYLRATEDPEDAIEIINAFEYCVERMLDTEDECELLMQLHKCVDKKLDEDG